ncbi:MAG: bifunctional 5,10-methylene-tetrahydrofolate dehydrogenase/5,10-methylene-tetrahydrofolate cyclohydrolase [Oscillospiraceae bacterium]|nr:bifunctional 5,10-methylene-tetrahydrofolate dehydrogenase/5,10-methylene-tetrahydrofolate cyclohydrolase [Oscillospiraceae bacterium]
MSAEILKGAAVAAALNEGSKAFCLSLREKGICPCLAIVRVGERGDDIAYERGILKRCSALDVEAKQIILPENIAQDELVDLINGLNKDDGVHGILVFMPLPSHIDEAVVRESISPEKDIDGVTSGSAAFVYSGKGSGFAPCTAQAVIEILKYYNIKIASRRVAVFGRSMVIGKPVSMLLMGENATVTVCHSKTAEGAEIAKHADIIIAALGKAKALREDYFREGQCVIDVGINFDEDGKMCGDVDFVAAEALASYVTPVPGGVGAVTTAVLLRHTLESAEKMVTKK